MAPRSRSPARLLGLGLGLGLVLLGLTLTLAGTPTRTLAQRITWARCASDIEAMFQADFPEWTPSPTSGRRLAEDEGREDPATRARADRRARSRRLQSELGAAGDAEIISQRFQGYRVVPSASPASAAQQRLASLAKTSGVAGGSPAPSSRVGEIAAVDAVFDSSFAHAEGDEFRPPTDPSAAYWRARAAAAGCTSCANGCCDGSDVVLDCGTYSTPIDYATTGPNITLTVYRVRLIGALAPATSSQRTQLWLLQGGPGGSGLSILFLAVSALQYATDILVPDHRGTGRAAGLSCPVTQGTSASLANSKVSNCVSELASNGRPIRAFSVSNAARDLGRLVAAAKAEFSPASVGVWGYSYGTYWAQRFLQLYPNLADRVVIEGIVAKNTYFNDFALGSQSAGDRLMAKCRLDAACAANIPNGDIKALLDAIAARGSLNPCSVVAFGTSGAQTLKTDPSDLYQFAQVVLYKSLTWGIDGPYNNSAGQKVTVDLRVYAVTMFYRWKACTSTTSDSYRVFVAALTWFLSQVGGLTGEASVNAGPASAAITSAELQNEILYSEVIYSELYRAVESQSAYEKTFNSSIVWGVVDAYTDYLGTYNAWTPQAYSKDGYYGAAPSGFSSQMLLLNGEIDGQTPRSQAYATLSDLTPAPSGSKTLVVAPDEGHHASGITGNCAANAAKAFFSGGTVSTTCSVGQSAPAVALASGFTIDPTFSATLLGANDVWTGTVTPTFCNSASSDSGCVRCHDYCYLLSDASGYCACLSALGKCLAKVGGSTYGLLRCRSLRDTYATSPNTQISQYGFGGACYTSCNSASAGSRPGTSAMMLVALALASAWLGVFA